MEHLKRTYVGLIEIWFLNFIQIGAVTMSNSKESSVRMKIYGLGKSILTLLMKKRRRQNSILEI